MIFKLSERNSCQELNWFQTKLYGGTHAMLMDLPADTVCYTAR